MPNNSPASVPMPEQAPLERVENFSEVSLGYSAEAAIEEAMRCLNCKNPPCVTGCPVNIRIPQFISHIASGRFEEAYREITDTNSLPAVCGRVCPQEIQCSGKCVRGAKGEPVAIGRLERYAADWHAENSRSAALPDKETRRTATASPLSARGRPVSLAPEPGALGYDVTVFEALHKAGGVLVYGMPVPPPQRDRGPGDTGSEARG